MMTPLSVPMKFLTLKSRMSSKRGDGSWQYEAQYSKNKPSRRPQPLTTISGLPVMSKMVLMTAAPATMRSERSLDRPAIFLRLALVRVVIS